MIKVVSCLLALHLSFGAPSADVAPESAAIPIVAGWCDIFPLWPGCY